MNNTVLNDKYFSAKLPDICAPRFNLIKTFQQHCDKRVLFVSAPAGFGKTISTLLWLSSSKRKNIWIGLDEYDNSPSVFYKLLCSGLQSVCALDTFAASMLKGPSFAASPVEHTICFLSELECKEDSYVLVLDDMHLITNKEILKSLPYVIKRLPLSILTVILTRSEQNDFYSTYADEGKTARITAEDLTFSAFEIQNYFKSYGRFITPDEALALKEMTGGWAIGVSVLAKSGQMELGQKNEEALSDYMKDQIWSKWDRKLQNFMLYTCIVDELTVSLANRLTGQNDSHEILNQLCASNSFVSHPDAEHYCYHRIFLEFLRKELTLCSDTVKHTLYKNAAEYYLENMDEYHSIHFSILAESYDSLSEAILKIYQYTTAGSSVATHVSMQSLYLRPDTIPESFISNAPYLLISHTWYCYLTGDVERFCFYLNQMYQKLPEIAEHYVPFLQHGLYMTMLDFRCPVFELFKFMTPEMIAELSKQNTKTTTLTENFPFIHRSHRDYSDFAFDIEGNMAIAEQLFFTLLDKDYTSIAKSLQAMLYYEKNRLKDACECSAQAITALLPDTVAELKFSVMITNAAILHAMGQETSAWSVLSKIQSEITKQSAEYLLPNFKAYETKLLLEDGDRKAAMEWLENYFVTRPENLELYKIFQHFTTARAYLVLENEQEALYYIHKLKKLGEDFQRPFDVAEACILQAILEWAFQNRKEALVTLEQVLTMTQKYGFIRIYAQEGAALLPLLKKLSQKLERADYTGILDPHYIHEITLAAYEQSKRKKGLTTHLNPKAVKLSKQQKNILTLLSKGYRYKEIMEETGLTIHTVKSHATAAYAKLGANNSLDAVIKARELGLMD